MLSKGLLCVVAVLAATTSLASALPTVTTSPTTTTTTTTLPTPKTFEWKWDNLWTNCMNWETGVCPAFGDDVTFPDFVGSFNYETCDPTDSACLFGSTVTFNQNKDGTPYQAFMNSLEFPSTSILSFEDDGFISFSQTAVSSSLTWLDRGESSRDFMCAANWIVNGDLNNAAWATPCITDTIDLSSLNSTSTYISPLTFIQATTDPNGLLTNRHMVSGGELIRFDRICPQPFGTDSGLDWCYHYCINTCSMQNPNATAGIKQQLQNLETAQTDIQVYLDVSNNLIAQLDQLVPATGQVTFQPIGDAYDDVIVTVGARIQRELPAFWPGAITFSCYPATGGVRGVTCDVSAQIPQVQVGAYTIMQSTEYVFRAGLMNSVFDDIVQQMFFKEQSADNLANAIKTSSTPFVSAQLEVPYRFMSDLTLGFTTPFPTSDVINALAARFNLNASSIGPITVYNSTRPGITSIFSFTVFTVNTTGITNAYLTSMMLAGNRTLPIFSVTLSSGVTTALYNPTVKETATKASLNVLRLLLVNQDLFNNVPLGNADFANFTTSLKNYLSSKGVGGVSDILQLQVFKDPTALASSRRAPTPTVVVAATVPATSSLLLNNNLASIVGQLTYGSSNSSSGGASAILSFDDLVKLATNSSLAQYKAAINMAVNQTSEIGNEIQQYGAPVTFQATGLYSWGDIDGVVPALSNGPIANDDCKILSMVYPTAASLAAAYQQTLASFLPAPPSAFKFTTLQCVPAISNQKLKYQDSYIQVRMTVSAPYIYFANQPYVTYGNPARVDHSLQFSEDSAPLSQASVHDAVNRATQQITLSAKARLIQQEIWTLRPTTTTTVAPSGGNAAASSSGGGGLLFAAAGAGAGVLILIIIVVILVTRRNRASPGRKQERSVVAFENPMYDQTSAVKQPTYDSNAGAEEDAQGLYDEPAFKTQTDKENPVYESTENIVEAHQDIGGYEQGADNGQDDGGYLDVHAE